MAQLKDVALPPDADRLGPNPDPYLQAFEPNAAAEHPRLDAMRCLWKYRYGIKFKTTKQSFINKFLHGGV